MAEILLLIRKIIFKRQNGYSDSLFKVVFRILRFQRKSFTTRKTGIKVQARIRADNSVQRLTHVGLIHLSLPQFYVLPA